MNFFSKKKLREPDKKMYRLAVYSVIGLVVFNQLLIQYILHLQWNDARTVSLASKQRLLCYQIVDLISKDESSVGSELVSNLSNEWNTVHYALQKGSDELGVDKLDGAEVVSLFTMANPYQFKIFDQATGNSKLGNIDDLQQSATIFSGAMDQIVTKCEDYSRFKISAIILVEVALALLTLLVLMFEIVYIFKPAFLKIKQQKMHLKRENVELAKTQHLLQIIQDSTPVANVVVNNDYKIISFNRQAEMRMKFMPHMDLKEGEVVTNYLPEHMKESFVAKMKQVHDQRYSSCEVFCLVDLHGRTRWFDVEFHVVIDQKGMEQGTAFSMKDITNVKEYEMDLLEQNEKLRHIAFLQAHELRGPITSMQGLISLMVEENRSKGFEEGYGKEFTILSNKVDKIVKTIVAESESSHLSM